MYYVTMQITFLTHKFRNVERNLHCDIVHITTVWVSSLTVSVDCNAFPRLRYTGREPYVCLRGNACVRI